MNIKVIVVDDEEPARELIKVYLKSYPDITLAGETDNGYDALKLIKELHPDLVFLDIQMPKLTGMETLELMEDNTAEVIFSTAFDHFAIRAFELNAVDYLLKPYSRARFDAALQKAIGRIKTRSDDADSVAIPAQALQASEVATVDTIARIAVKQRHQIYIIPVSEIDYIEADGDYVQIYAQHTKYLKERTMKFFENSLPPQQFVRIHRSCIVNVDKVVKIELYEKEGYHVKLSTGATIKASTTGYKLLRERVRL
jgi:two-component system LytT family response regulator